jgi:hypothetical protein
VTGTWRVALRRRRWGRRLLAGLAISLVVATGGVAVPGGEVGAAPDTTVGTMAVPAAGEGPEPTGREVPPMGQRVIDTAVWVWILVVVAVAAGWVVVRWRHSGDPPDGADNPHH